MSRAGRSPTPPPRSTRTGGYQVQDLDRAERLAAGERLVGAKLGVTSRAKQRTMGVAEPIVGFLTDATQLGTGDDEQVLARTAQPRVEPEIAFRLGRTWTALSPRGPPTRRSTRSPSPSR